MDILLGDDAVANSTFFADVTASIDDDFVPFIAVLNCFEEEKFLEVSSIDNFDTFIGDGADVDFVSAAERFSWTDDGCVSFMVFDFKVLLVDDRMGFPDAVEGFKDKFSKLFEDLPVASFILPAEDNGCVDDSLFVVVCVTIVAELGVDRFWRNRLLVLRLRGTWSLAEEVFGLNLLTCSPTICDLLEIEDLELSEVLVLGFRFGDGLVDDDVLARDLLEFVDGELEVALGLLLPIVDEDEGEYEGEDERDALLRPVLEDKDGLLVVLGDEGLLLEFR